MTTALAVLVHDACIDCSTPRRQVWHMEGSTCPRKREHPVPCSICGRVTVITTTLVCQRQSCRELYFAPHRSDLPGAGASGTTAPRTVVPALSAPRPTPLRVSGRPGCPRPGHLHPLPGPDPHARPSGPGRGDAA